MNEECGIEILQPFHIHICESCYKKGFRLIRKGHFVAENPNHRQIINEALTEKLTIFREKEGIF